MQCTIKEFHDFIHHEKINLQAEKVNVLSSKGMVRIHNVAITSQNSKVVTVRTNTLLSLSASDGHLLKRYPDKWTPISKLNIGSNIYTEDGYASIGYIRKSKIKMDLYDLEVEGNEYYTNGITSHNSSISNSFKISFFGKVANMTQSDFINRKNGRCETYTAFTTSNNDNIILNRKIQPSSLMVTINGVPEDKKKDMKSYIEDELIDMTSDVFDNMLAPSINDFKSFLTMSPADKRKIIDKVFSLLVYNKIRDDVRKKIREYETDISVNEKNLKYIESNIEETQEDLELLLESLNDQKEKDVSLLESKLQKIKDNEIKLEELYVKYKSKYDSINKQYTILDEQFRQLKYDIKTYVNNLTLYDDDVCPTCKSDLTTGDHQLHKEELEKKLKDAELERDNLAEELIGIEDKLKKVKDKRNELEDKRYTYRSTKAAVVEKIEEIKESSNDKEEVKVLEKIINDNKGKSLTVKEKITKGRKNKKFLSIVEDVVGDGGVKSLVISTIVPLINKYINEYLGYFTDIPFRVEFDSEFNSTIKQFNYEVTPKSLSTGESKILDFCVLVAMIKILKVKYTNLNILFLDELFASLDLDNINHVLDILKKFSRDMKLNIFIIHHNHIERGWFDNYIQINKENGFSDIMYIGEEEEAADEN